MPATPDPTAPEAGTGKRSLGREALRGIAWTGAASMAQFALQLGVLAALARLLTPAEIGVATAVASFAAAGALLREVGAGQTLVQLPDLGPGHIRTAWTVSIAMAVVVCVGTVAIASPIAILLRLPEAAPLVRIAGVAMAVDCLAMVPMALLQRGRNFQTIVAFESGAFLTGPAGLAVLLAWAGWGAGAVVAGSLVRAVIVTLLAIARHPPDRLGIDRTAFRAQLGQGGGMSVAKACNWLAIDGYRMLIARVLGGHALGIYGRAHAVMAAPAVFFGSAVERVMFPLFAAAQGDPARLRGGYLRSIALVGLVGLPASAVLAVLAPEVVAILLGPAWSEVVPVLRAFAVCTYLRIAFKPSATVLRGLGRAWLHAVWQAMYAALVVAGVLVGFRWGLIGVAVGVSCALAMITVCSHASAIRLVGADWGEALRGQAPGVALAALVLAVAWPAAVAARAAGLPAIAGLPVVVVAALTAAAAGAAISPRWFLGEHGRWLLGVLRERLPVRRRQG